MAWVTSVPFLFPQRKVLQFCFRVDEAARPLVRLERYKLSLLLSFLSPGTVYVVVHILRTLRRQASSYCVICFACEDVRAAKGMTQQLGTNKQCATLQVVSPTSRSGDWFTVKRGGSTCLLDRESMED